MKTLVDLMTKDSLLCAGKFTQMFKQKTAKQKWEVIAEHLTRYQKQKKAGVNGRK